MKSALYIILFICIASCNSSPEKNNELQGDFCFELREGTSGQDVTSLHIIIKGDSVSGTMDWIPFEKDAAHGVLNGYKNGDTLLLKYEYMIEGIHQSEETIWLYQKDKLLKKTGELVAEKETHFRLKDPLNAPFNKVFTNTDCK